MELKVNRYFGPFLSSQEKWLNQMAGKGYRLMATTQASYEFVKCTPGKYQYAVEFIGKKSRSAAEEYAAFLQSCGCRVFFKNLNLGYSIGKVEVRPWAEKGGHIATKSTTLGRELLIVEKRRDGTPFPLQSTLSDKIRYYKGMQSPWWFFLLVCLVDAILLNALVWGICGVIALACILVYQREIWKLKKDAALQNEPALQKAPGEHHASAETGLQ